MIIFNFVPQVKVLSGKYRHNTSNYWELGVRIMRRERRNGVIMSESYAVNEKKRTDLAESQGVYCGTRWDRKEKSVGRIAH